MSGPTCQECGGELKKARVKSFMQGCMWGGGGDRFLGGGEHPGVAAACRHFRRMCCVDASKGTSRRNEDLEVQNLRRYFHENVNELLENAETLWKSGD